MANAAGGSWNGNVMSASSLNRRRILSLWLPRLPIDRIRRVLSGSNGGQGKAFSSEVGTGSREENASKQKDEPSIVVAKDNNIFRSRSYSGAPRVCQTGGRLMHDDEIDELAVVMGLHQHEARAIGADAILLILAALPDDELVRDLQDLAWSLGLAVVVEAHTVAEGQALQGWDVGHGTNGWCVGIRQNPKNPYHAGQTRSPTCMTLKPCPLSH